MPPYPLFRHLPFDQERIDLISSVFEDLSAELELGQSVDPIRDLVALAVITCA